MIDKIERITITKHSNIGQVISAIPAINEILLQFQLGCGGCSISEFENFADGIMSHGYSEELVDDVIRKCNVLLDEYYNMLDEKGIYITEKALDKLDYFAEEMELDSYGIILQITQDPEADNNYMIDIQNELKDGQMELEYNEDLIIYIKKHEEEDLQGIVIDFIDGDHGQGFKISNLNDSSF